jgi:hypothetical protein
MLQNVIHSSFSGI